MKTWDDFLTSQSPLKLFSWLGVLGAMVAQIISNCLLEGVKLIGLLQRRKKLSCFRGLSFLSKLLVLRKIRLSTFSPVFLQSDNFSLHIWFQDLREYHGVQCHGPSEKRMRGLRQWIHDPLGGCIGGVMQGISKTGCWEWHRARMQGTWATSRCPGCVQRWSETPTLPLLPE